MPKARQQYFADEVTLQKENRDFAITPEIIEKLDSIEEGAQVNVIETVKVNGEALTPDEEKAVDISVPLVDDTLYSTSSEDALSARQGRILYDYIQNIQSRGRFLSNWNCATGLAMTNPADNPYAYRVGDYYLVSTVAALGGTNYRPDGSEYIINQASTTVETDIVKVSDMYIYDGTNWLLLVNTEREIAVDSSLSTTSTNPVENRVITNALNGKQDTLIAGTNIQIAADGKTISATDTTYESKPAASGGTDVSLVTTGEKYVWNEKQDKLVAGNNISIAADGKTISAVDTTYASLPASQGGINVSLVTTGEKYTWNNKQDTLIAGTNIQIAADGKTISATDTTYTAGANINIDANNEISAVDTTYTAGTNISIDANNEISAVDTTYPNLPAASGGTDDSLVTTGEKYTWDNKQDELVAGTNIQIAADGKTISATDTTYVAGDFDIKDLADSTGLRTEWSGKQDELIAGTNVQIASDGKTISATDTTYTAGANISISNNNVISATDSKAVWGSISGTLSDQTDLGTALGGKQDTLIAGTNVQIASDGKTISATDTTYTAGTGISIDSNNVISNTQTSAEWGNITGTLSDQTDLNTALGGKQDTLVAGSNIQIAADGKTISATDTTYTAGTNVQISSGNVISATDTTYTASDFDVKDLADTTGLRTTWSGKQDALIAGTNIQIAADGKTISATDTTYTAGTNVQINNGVISATDTTYNTATSSTAGLVKLGSNTLQTEAAQSASSTAGRTYPVQLNSSDQMVVNVPWEDTQTGSATSTAAGTVKLFSDTTQTETAQSVSSTANRTYGIQNNSSNQMVVNVPWTDTTYGAGTYLTINGTTFDVDTTLIATKSDLANFAGFQVVATLPTSDIKTNIIYLLGPFTSTTGSDKYEEWIYSNNNWIMIGETSVDLSPYFNYTTQTSDAITEGSTNLFLTSTERTKLGNTSGTNTGDETKTTIQTKLGAASASNSGYLTSTDWSTFNSKANTSDIKNKVFPLPRQNDNISDIITLLNNGGSVTFYEPYSELATVVGYRYYTVVNYEQQNNVIKAEGEAATVSITLTYGTTTVASVTTEGGKVKKFSLSSTSDMSTAEKIVEWYNLGGVPVILYNSHLYTFQLYEYSSQTGKSYYTFYADVNSSDSTSTSSLNNRKIMIEYNPNGVFPYSISDLNSPFVTVLKTGVDYATPYTPEYDGSPATKKYVDDNKTEYNAGKGIEIGDNYSAMQGPAPDGFHVPLNTEWQAVRDIRVALGGGSSDGTNFGIALKLPFAGRRSYSSASASSQGSIGYYWSSSRFNANNAYYLYFYSSELNPQENSSRANGFSVRCFKNSPVVPNSSWTKLYGTSIESGGIFWSSTDGLISLSSDGTTWITIADKNLGATTVWNSGNTLKEANCGKYYQRGNNYGFPFIGTIANQSTTQVDASNYGPGNYYSSDTFIKYNGRWDSTDNGNLWGGVTGVVTDVITNTGVLSVNGQTGDVVINTPTAGTGIDITNNIISTDLVAGDGVDIFNGICTVESDKKGPCDSGFHIPDGNDWDFVCYVMGDGVLDLGGFDWISKLHMPLVGSRDITDGAIAQQGTNGYYHSCSAIDDDNAYGLSFTSSSNGEMGPIYKCNGSPIRAFKNEYVTPTSSWTVLAGSLGSAGIFWDRENGLISITDGYDGVTMQDKNVGATVVYSYGDTLTQANMGNVYQWGNNYGFPSTGTITTTNVQVDASSYGPGNYYSGNVFIQSGNLDFFNWDSSNNYNLWGDVSGGTHKECVQSGNTLTISSYANTKAFYLTDTNDLATAQAIVDYFLEGNNPIILYSDTEGKEAFMLLDSAIQYGSLIFASNKVHETDVSASGYSRLYQPYIYINVSSNIVTDIDVVNNFYIAEYIKVNKNYGTPYTPQYNGSPTTKKYVDDRDTYIGSSAPTSNLIEGRLWYDTTNDQLKVYDGTNWSGVGGGGGDMSYSDFNWASKSGATVTLDLASTITPSANFTVNAPATIKDGQTYILRVNNGATAYTMTLGTNVTNPFDTDITLTANGIDQFVFLAINGELELQPEGGGGGGGSSDAFILAPNSPLTPKYFWYGTQAQYDALSQYYTDEENDTVYFTI